MTLELSKKLAGEKAVDFVEDGNVVGLGTGSTTEYFIKKLAQRISDKGLDIIGIPTSKKTERLARKLGIRLSSLNEYPEIDVDIDGADEVDGDFNLIKGGGGAHTREKIVANASRKFIVVVDHSKKVERLGHFPVPVEVFRFCEKFVEIELGKLGGIPTLRKGFKTDEGNLVIDTRFNMDEPSILEDRINQIPGVIDNGIFSKRRPERVVVGYIDEVKILEK